VLAQIESGIVAILEQAGLGLSKVEVRSKGSVPKKPAGFVACRGGKFKKKGQRVWGCETTIIVLVMFENFANEDKRRAGMNIILEGIVLKLAGNSLGLDIKPLTPVDWNDVTDDALAGEGLLLFELVFSTEFDLRPPENDEEEDLLTVGLSYYLQDPADDHRVDANDTVDLNTQGGD